MKTYLLSVEEAARWLREPTREPARKTVGCLVKAVPPLRSYAHVSAISSPPWRPSASAAALPDASRDPALPEGAQRRGPRGVARHRDRAPRQPQALRLGPGAQFTAEAFRTQLRTVAIRQRFGAIGQYGSIAIVERLWKGLKELLGLSRWTIVHPQDMGQRVEAALTSYAHLKPHQGLVAAVPAEVHFGIR